MASTTTEPGTAAALAAVTDVARATIPPEGVITDHSRLRTYECDGLAHYRVTPALVVIPEDARQLAAVVRACAEQGLPFVARGSGTGLSGGALPHAEGVLIVTSRMRAITELRPEDQRAVVDPGVINLDVTRAATPHGYYYAPDPSSQQICSIGGNVAENSGGAHCLKYGFTTNHVLGAEFVTAAGDTVMLGGAAPDSPGYDLLGAVVGSGRAADDLQPGDRADRGQGLAAEAERADVEQGFGEFRGAVPADGERQILRAHAAAIVRHAQQGLAATGRGDLDPRRAGVDGVLDQLLGGAGRTLDHLAGGDLIDHGFGKLADLHGSS